MVVSGSDIDLNLTNIRFVFSDENVVVRWNLRTPTDCAVEYRVVVSDSELGVVLDEYVDEPYIELEAMSPCIGYNVRLSSINKAVPTPEGPAMTTSIQFHSRGT